MKLSDRVVVLFCIILGLVCLFTTNVFAGLQDSFPIKDFRGKTIRVPKQINRVVTISDGMVEGVMTRLGQAHKIVALGSACVPKTWAYDIPGQDGKSVEYETGMNPVTHLNPGFKALPLVTRSGAGINYETVAALDPDVVIIRTGSCSLCQSKDVLAKNIDLLESLGVPLVVLQGPNTMDRPDIATVSREIILLGKVFQQEAQARSLARYLESCVNLVQERTASVRPEERKKLLLGLSPKARSQGGAAHVKGDDTLQSYFLDKIVNADNAYEASGAWNILGTEQVMALDPDLIVLVTAWGYHPPEELYEAPYYQGLAQMRAVQNQAVVALPWTPCNCEKRLEYPIDIMVMAKAAYPERFKDIKLGQWLLDFYQNVYNVDLKTADQLMSRQWMDWARKE